MAVGRKDTQLARGMLIGRILWLICRNLLLLYTLIVNYHKKNLGNNPIYVKRIKYRGINLTKKVKDLYSENYKHWWRNVKMIKRNGKISCVPWLEGLMLLKMAILSKAIYRFNAITIKIPRTLSQKYNKMILKIFWNHKRLNCQNWLETKNSWMYHVPYSDSTTKLH